jgi:flavocytochrome c
VDQKFASEPLRRRQADEKRPYRTLDGRRAATDHRAPRESSRNKEQRGKFMSLEELQTDVIVIGGGGAGVPAAIEAGAAGARVTLIERAAELGGTALLSGGGCCIPGTPLQESLGIHDTVDLAFEEWVKWGQGAADEPWARYYLEHSLHDLYFWAEKHGVQWVGLMENEGNSVARWHRPANTGYGLMRALIAALEAQGTAQLVTGSTVEKLLVRNRKVCGVRIVDNDSGAKRQIFAEAVIVATGGFASNLDLVLEVRPELKAFKVMEGSGPGATGLGHRLIREQGGYFTHMEDIVFYVYATPDHRHAGSDRGIVFRGTPGYVWVNQSGRRFHNESLWGANSATPAVLRQNPPHAWAILDSAMARGIQLFDPYYRDEGEAFIWDRIRETLTSSPYIRHADSLEQLAHAIDVPAETFVAELSAYNEAFDKGLDIEPRFGKPLKGCKKFDTPPYFAIQLFPLARKNLGGVKTDMRCRVLDKSFEPIPGLYAAGEVAGMAGGHINGKAPLEGTMLGPSIFSGRVAGAWAAHEAGRGAGFAGQAR